MDPPQHTRLRKLAAKAFTVRRADAIRPRVQSIVDSLVDGLEAGGSPGGVRRLPVEW